MIEEKFVDLYARNSGLQDKLLVERDVVLTYALQALVQDGVMESLAFKGGTCLRKQVFGSDGRFSEALDFTADTAGNVDDTLERLLGVFDRDHFGISFKVGDFYRSRTDPGATRPWRNACVPRCVPWRDLRPASRLAGRRLVGSR